MGNWDEATKLSSIETAMRFYLNALSGDLDTSTRKQYLGIAREIMKVAKDHPKREEYERRLRTYENGLF